MAYAKHNTRPPAGASWWKHLRKYKRAFWKAVRRNNKVKP